jgi:subtilase family serine protease
MYPKHCKSVRTKFTHLHTWKSCISAITGVLGCAGVAFAQGTPNHHANDSAFVVHSAPVCPGPANVGTARCHAWVVTGANGVPRATGVSENAAGPNAGHGGHGGSGGGSSPPPPPDGAYGPAQFQTAYGLLGKASGGATVAIVDAYDNPTIEQDLAVYSGAYGLPSCTSTNGCLKKVDQSGGTNYPRANSGWALEIALDVQAVHAVCPDCNILLVEARSNSLSNLLTAESYAASQANVVVVSNSWGGGEFSSETAYDSYLDYGKPITVSSGDSGYGVEWPAASAYVTAVGGTTLNLSGDNSRSSETVWSGSGSGCSAYEFQPVYQLPYNSDPSDPSVTCSNRIVADVAADADPATGAAVYDSYGYAGQAGWFTVGGTSLASPIIAAVYALAGNTEGASTVYYNATNATTYPLYDVTNGFNGSCGTYLCDGVSGYDGPSGLGTPNGFGAF